MTIPVEAPFVAQVRTRPGVIRIGAPDAAVMTVRVQGAEAWDMLRLEVPPSEPILTVKRRALEILEPSATHAEDYVLKLHGFEVLDEDAPVSDTGARNGSTFLLAHRRRRPVK